MKVILDKMRSDSLILSLKRHLLDLICEQWTEETCRLIRKHDKKLELGDFSFPSLDNDKVWGKFQLKTKSLNDIQDASSLLRKVSQSGHTIVVNLDRKSLYQQYFQDGPRVFVKDSSKMSNVKNSDLSKPNSSEMTSARANCISEVLVNLPKTSNKTIVISSTDLSSQIQVLEIIIDDNY